MATDAPTFFDVPVPATTISGVAIDPATLVFTVYNANTVVILDAVPVSVIAGVARIISGYAAWGAGVYTTQVSCKQGAGGPESAKSTAITVTIADVADPPNAPGTPVAVA